MVWAALIDEGLAQLIIETPAGEEAVDGLLEADASAGSYGPSPASTGAGTATNFPPDDVDFPNQRDPDQRDPDRRDPNQRDPDQRDPRERREPTNKERVRDMREGTIIDAVLGALGNIAFGGVTETISVGSNAGRALGEGLIELDRNYHEGMGGMTGVGGSGDYGKNVWDAIDAENRTEPWPRRKK